MRAPPVGRRGEGQRVTLHQVADHGDGLLSHCLRDAGSFQKLLQLPSQLLHLGRNIKSIMQNVLY